MHKRIAIFDFDNTLITKNSYYIFLLRLLKSKRLGLKQILALISIGFFYKVHALGSKIAIKMIVSIAFKNVAPLSMEQLILELHQDIIKSLKDDVVLELMKEKRSGSLVIIMSAGLNLIIRGIFGEDGILIYATKINFNKGDNIWHLDGDVPFGRVKLDLVNKIKNEFGKNFYTIVYTDSFSDRPILTWADEAVVVNPGIFMRVYAYLKGWRII